MDIQLKRGLLEVCVLAAMREKDAYGYELVKDISPYIEISESTLYPILKRLETGGNVNSYSVAHNGRLRKYYRITGAGRDRIRDFLGDWKDMVRVYEFIEGGEAHDEN